jgi:hypothetical protein
VEAPEIEVPHVHSTITTEEDNSEVSQVVQEGFGVGFRWAVNSAFPANSQFPKNFPFLYGDENGILLEGLLDDPDPREFVLGKLLDSELGHSVQSTAESGVMD